MADYWKSGERHFCTFCKCWLAGNKISINLHESGNHHKSNVKAKIDQMRKTSLEKERTDKELNTTLGQMERAANESFQRDLAANSVHASHNAKPNTSSTSESNLPSKLKRTFAEPVQVQIKKPKFVIKTPTPKPVFEPIATPETKTIDKTPPKTTKVEETPSVTSKIEKTSPAETNKVKKHSPSVISKVVETSVSKTTDPAGVWYESKTESQDSFYWNDTTGESSWTPPAVYLSIEQQRAKGLKV